MANPPAALTTQQFIDLGKVPDFVRDVKPFTGNPTKLIDWITDVESIFRTYRENGATAAQINILERTIRRKVEDASDYAIGAVLSQGDIGKDKPIHFASRTLSKTEEGSSVPEKEISPTINFLTFSEKHQRKAKALEGISRRA
ncbi:uncharacterized protein LOC129759815 [Uranotaenia lowii]|uniref:uncharacterized protein LOC129759815 n=1 Tax=Uranotaenia lowii TaxID=190385 RepID=UPI002479EE93|nr:uncharacterized protein LOC129759815 [Uranotaenia lowii]